MERTRRVREAAGARDDIGQRFSEKGAGKSLIGMRVPRQDDVGDAVGGFEGSVHGRQYFDIAAVGLVEREAWMMHRDDEPFVGRDRLQLLDEPILLPLIAPPVQLPVDVRI